MNLYDKIYIAGHNGMVGSAVLNKFNREGFQNIIIRSSNELDLRVQRNVSDFFKNNSPDYVILAAAKVGGIMANNKFRADFIYDNLMIQSNIIHACHNFNVKKLLFLGSSCIYPKYCEQPIKEEFLLTGQLEYTNEPYAIAKIAGIKLCESYFKQHKNNFISIMPSNLYGPNDNFDLESSHVMPALIRKFYEAKKNKDSAVKIWGTGRPKREFLHVQDMADACYYIMKNIDAYDIYEKQKLSHINIGTGEDISIKNLAHLIRKISKFEGNIEFEISKPDGTLKKLLDVSLINKLGWESRINLADGLTNTYDWYVNNL